MLYFEKIKYSNIMSVGQTPVEVDFSSAQSTLIIGSNGQGKSTLLEALIFCLYGKPFRKINKGQLVNWVNKKALLVELWLRTNGKSYHIRRGIKPNLFEIYEDGEKWGQESKDTLMQAALEERVLKIGMKSFTQTAMLGMATYVPFMQLDAAARRKFVEDFLEIEIFKKMNDIVKSKNISNNGNITKVESDNSVLEARIDGIKDKISALKVQNAASVDKIKAKMKAEIDSIQYSTEMRDSLKFDRDEFYEQNKEVIEDNETFKELERVRTSLVVVTRATSPHESAIKFYENHAECPTCNQYIDNELRRDKVVDAKNEISNISKQKETLEAQISSLSKKLSDRAEIVANLAKLDSEINHYNTEISFAKKSVKDLANEIQEASNESIDTSADEIALEKLEEKHGMIEGVLKTLYRNKEVYAAALSSLKDDGMKADAIEEYVPVINQLIKEYLEKFGLYIEFSLDSTFEETILSSNAEEASYNSFSEGERLRIDLSILFVWRQIAKMRNSSATNFLIMDEVLDSSLDQEGMLNLIDVLKNIFNEENIFIISHKGDGIDERFDRVLRMKKVKGFTLLDQEV